MKNNKIGLLNNYKVLYYYDKAIARLHIAIIRKTYIKDPLTHSDPKKGNHYWILGKGQKHIV